MLKTLSLSTVSMLFVTAAAAQQLTGGDIRFSYAAPTDGDIDLDGFNLSASTEFAVNREIALQGDLSFTDIQSGDFSEDAYYLGAHAIYHANDNASFGAYLGQTNIEGTDLTSYGVEGGYEFARTNLSGYFGVTRLSDGLLIDEDFDIEFKPDFNQLGLSISHDVSDVFSVSGRFDRASLSNALTVKRFGLGAEYQISQSIGLSAEIGVLDGDFFEVESDNETYMNVAATYSFGAERGATFGQNDLLTSLLGF